jgi:hypothetical protein
MWGGVNKRYQEMKRQELIEQLQNHHQAFIEYINSLTDEEFLVSHHAKWTAGQQLQHICLSVRPVNLALLIPKFMLRLLFGKPLKKRNYEELVKAYQNVLHKGGKAGTPYIPKSVRIHQKQKLISDLTKLIASLIEKINQLSEDDLDQHILPHPLIGKTSIREMLYFTMYHVKHHHEQLVKNLNK